MKIAFLLPSLEPRGPNIFTQYLISGLLVKGCEIEIFYFRSSKKEIRFDVPCHKISLFIGNTFSQFQIVHSTMAIPDLYVFIYRNIIKARHVISLHNFISEDLGMLYGIIEARIKIKIWKFALTSNSAYIYSSEYMKNYYDKFLGNFYSQIIPYGIPISFNLDADYNDKKLLSELRSKFTIIGSVGLLIKRKGFEQLIELLYVNKNIAVVIIGEGYLLDFLNNLAYQKGVKDRFYILGYKNNSSRYYKYFDIFAMVSYSEGFGMALIESLGHGLPLLCSKLPIYNGIISDDFVGFYKPGNIQELNFAFKKLNENRLRYQEFSKKLYNEKFSLKKMVESHLEFYSKLIKN